MILSKKMISKKALAWVGVSALFSSMVLSVAQADQSLYQGIFGGDFFPVKAEWSCQSETWSVPLHYDVDGLLKGTITSLCQAPQTTRQGFSSLSDVLLDETVRNTYRVFAGPISGTYLNMPAIRYDLTTRYENKQDPLFVRSDLYVATDKATRLVYANNSKEVSSTGMAKYVKKVDMFIDVVPDGKTGFFYRISGSTAAEKPFFAPDGTFKAQAEKYARKQYLETRNQMAPIIADSL